MNPRSLSTSNSDDFSKRRRDSSIIAVSMIVTLVLIDLMINVFFTYSIDRPPESVREKIARYFDYGRSIEGKLSKLVGQSDSDSAEIASAGWLDSENWPEFEDDSNSTGHVRVTIYGMSYAMRLGKALADVEPETRIRFIGSPAAPPNHAYSAFMLDRSHNRAPFVVIGIAATSLSRIMTMTGATWSFIHPYPYTYPLYRYVNERLMAVEPLIGTLEEFRQARNDPSTWASWRAQLRMNDSHFDSILFNSNVFDGSVTFRLLRYAWSQRMQQAISNEILTNDGFNEKAEAVQVLRRICRQFAAAAREDGRFPIIVLFNNRGFDDYLYKALHKTLEDDHIPYLSTHEIAPASNPKNFVKDGHFVEEVDLELAAELAKIIRYSTREF